MNTIQSTPMWTMGMLAMLPGMSLGADLSTRPLTFTKDIAGRQWGLFVISLAKDFGTTKLTWTLVSNGQTTTIPLRLNPLWEIFPFSEAGVGNTPPVITLTRRGIPRSKALGRWSGRRRQQQC